MMLNHSLWVNRNEVRDGLFKHTMLPATMQPCQLYHAASHASSTMQPCHLPCSQLNAELISCVNTFRPDVQLLVIINHVHIMLYQLVTCSSPVHFLMWIVTLKKKNRSWTRQSFNCHCYGMCYCFQSGFSLRDPAAQLPFTIALCTA